MHLDISRDTFDPNQQDPKKQQLQIFHEQGRVLIDAAMNHQIASMLHEMRVLATDMHGPHWGPATGGFAIGSPTDSDFTIGKGNYYVNGYRCAAVDTDSRYTTQPFLPLLTLPKTDSQLPDKPYLVYLDVWERLMTDISYPNLRDPALEQLDAPSASQIVWQVRVDHINDSAIAGFSEQGYEGEKKRKDAAKAAIGKLGPSNPGKLSAKPVDSTDATAQKSDDLCEEEIDERYRGLENQLYRIEIHSSGKAFEKMGEAQNATFKWSRDNGAYVFPISTWSVNDKTATVTLAHNGRDARSSLKAGDYVEYQDEITVLRADLFDLPSSPLSSMLFRVQKVDPYDPTHITLYGGDFDLPKAPEEWTFADRKAFLRRWDHQSSQALPVDTQRILDSKTPILASDNALLVVGAGEKDSGWIEIENGIQIHFSKEGEYKRGDYWLIPARYANGKILWPVDEAIPGSTIVPKEQPPRTIQHHYAPLAVVFKDNADNGKLEATDCRNSLVPKPTREVEFKAPGDISAGSVVVLSDLIGIARDKIKKDELGVLLVEGDFDVPKSTAQGSKIEFGVQLHWDIDNSVATQTPGTLRKIGICIQVAAEGVDKVRIRLSQ